MPTRADGQSDSPPVTSCARRAVHHHHARSKIESVQGFAQEDRHVNRALTIALCGAFVA